MDYKEWLEWRKKYFKENPSMSHEEKLIEEQQMEAWEEFIKKEDSGHRPS